MGLLANNPQTEQSAPILATESDSALLCWSMLWLKRTWQKSVMSFSLSW